MEEIEIPEESELQKKIKKIAKYIIGIFLIILMLSFLVPSDITGSLIEGKKIKNFQVDYRIELGDAKNTTISFNPYVYETIKSIYLKNQLTEISFCLTGTVIGNRYVVDSFYTPKTIFQTPVSVSSVICSQETIITIHTHPFKNCLLSQQDIASYQNYKKINPKALMSVMCSTERFAFYKSVL